MHIELCNTLGFIIGLINWFVVITTKSSAKTLICRC